MSKILPFKGYRNGRVFGMFPHPLIILAYSFSDTSHTTPLRRIHKNEGHPSKYKVEVKGNALKQKIEA